MDNFIQSLISLAWYQWVGIAVGLIVLIQTVQLVITRPEITLEFGNSILNVASAIANGLFINIAKTDLNGPKVEHLLARIEKLEQQLRSEEEMACSQQSNKPNDSPARIESDDNAAVVVEHHQKPAVAPFSTGHHYRLTSPANMLDEMIAWKLNEPVPGRSVEDLFQMKNRILEESTKWRQKEDLEDTFVQQLGSAARIRGLMINLFVVVNVSFILAMFFRPEQFAASKEIALGLYISFATFIVYVYRSSHARALILLAGKEDLKRYYDAETYLRSVGRRGPSERDIDVLKLLLLNRMEREKNSEHPYELVLKGVSNSNILMKGGKVMAQKSASKSSKLEKDE